MTELELYKFIEESMSETSIDDERAIIWVSHWDIEEFATLIGSNLLSEGGIEVRLQQHSIAIDLNELCEHHEIDVNNLFKKEGV